ncbi:hypothetical protein Ancab_036174 [Ancistrocladus abbreviatus]
MKASVLVVAVAVLVFVLASESPEGSVAAVTCSPAQLSSCANAIMSSNVQPSKLCCAKIKEQEPCLCQYLKNPSLSKFVNTPNARKVASTCGTPFPNWLMASCSVPELTFELLHLSQTQDGKIPRPKMRKAMKVSLPTPKHIQEQSIQPCADPRLTQDQFECLK